MASSRFIPRATAFFALVLLLSLPILPNPATAARPNLACILQSFKLNEVEENIDAFALLPENYKQMVKSEIGPLEAQFDRRMSPKKNQMWLIVQISAVKPDPEPGTPEKRHIMGFALSPSKRPGAIIMENLILEDPLSQGRDASRKGIQQTRGLPFSAILSLKQNLSKMLIKTGYSTIETNGPTSYVVSQLYRKILEFKPSDPITARAYDAIDQCYQYFLSEAPEEFRVHNATEFSRLLGTQSQPVEGPAKNYLRSFKKNATSSDRYFFLLDSEGRRMGLVEKPEDNNSKPIVYPLHPETGTPIRWPQLLEAGALALRVNMVK